MKIKENCEAKIFDETVFSTKAELRGKEILQKDCRWLEQRTAHVVVVVITPPLPRDGGTARTAIQVHAVNLIEIRKDGSPFRTSLE